MGNGQQQLKQNQKEQQHLNSPNQQINDDDADELVQRVKYLEKEVYVKQDAFNRDIHQEVEKIHEDTVEEEVVLVELIRG